MKITSLKIGLISFALIPSLYSGAVVDKSFVVITNQSVSLTSISSSQLKDIYTGKTTYWEGGQSIAITVLSDKADDALKEVSGMDASEFKTFWQRLTFSGRGQQPKKANDIAAAVSMVASTKGAIALVPADADLKGVKKLEIK